MDKSHPNKRTYIGLLDSNDEVRSKIRRAKTDSTGAFDIDDPNQGIANLVTMMSRLAKEPASDIVARYRCRGYGKLKEDLADIVIDFLGQVRSEYRKVRDDKLTLRSLMRLGLEKALVRSEKTLNEVKKACGLR
jgi:tryptophanyl-tRNA synthetase